MLAGCVINAETAPAVFTELSLTLSFTCRSRCEIRKQCMHPQPTEKYQQV